MQLFQETLLVGTYLLDVQDYVPKYEIYLFKLKSLYRYRISNKWNIFVDNASNTTTIYMMDLGLIRNGQRFKDKRSYWVIPWPGSSENLYCPIKGCWRLYFRYSKGSFFKRRTGRFWSHPQWACLVKFINFFFLK